MNRDTLPVGAELALATGELMSASRRAAATVPPGDPTAVTAAVRAALAQLWPKVPPEAARDVMIAAAEMACDGGIATLPESLISRYGRRELDGAAAMLELTGEWIAAGKPEPGPGPFTPPAALASSVAFDRDEDNETLTSLAVLLALAHPAIAERDDQAEPDDPYDVCPDCGEYLRDCWCDEGGPPCAWCGQPGCPGYCDDHQTYNLRPDETGGPS